MTEVSAVLSWIFYDECPVPSDVDDILIPGEKAMHAYKTVRDVAVFTDKRLIVRDAQGLTGKKAEIYSLPYTSILMYSTENGGMLDFDSEVQLWTKLGVIKISLKKKVDVRRLDRIIAEFILK